MIKNISVSPNHMRPRTKAGTKELARRINELISLVQRFPSRDFIDPTELLAKLNYWFSDLNGDLITTEWGYPLEEHAAEQLSTNQKDKRDVEAIRDKELDRQP
jgi:hypothetical protein